MYRHLEGDVFQDEYVGHHLRTSQITQDKASNLREHKLTESSHNLCKVSLLHSNSTSKIQRGRHPIYR